MSAQLPVVIIGAGMAGLSCAVYLQQQGIDALVLEGADGVGGRVRTDQVEGFRLDRGFQILLTAYPETKRLLNYAGLDLKMFRSGALIRHEDEWIKFINPLREPQSIFTTLASTAGTFGDKLKVVGLIGRLQGMNTTEIFNQQATTTYDYLAHHIGFSEQMITRFFRPFFGGIFLEDALFTSSNFFDFCFKMFYSGEAAIPALGIGQMADQVASRLKPEQIHLNTPVARLEGNQVHLATGEVITAQTVVLATDASATRQLLNHPPLPDSAFNHTTCTYFAAGPNSPNKEQLLMLNPRRSSAVHNLAVLSDVAPAYAPAGQTLISVSTQGLELVNEDVLAERIQRELTGWFGSEVKNWRHLKSYHIAHALPVYGPEASRKPLQLANHLYQCGDQTAYPSLNAAIQTGREVAELIASPRR